MRFTVLICALMLGFAACSVQKAGSGQPDVQEETKIEDQGPSIEKSAKTPVLVELFTSEGCSSCPPADEVLARLAGEQPVEGVEIVPLALHVDYWNYLGWRDRFSSAAFSERQTGYAGKFRIDSIYTPQMVVDGRMQFVGSRFETAVNSIKEAAAAGKSAVGLTIEYEQVKIDVAGLPAHDAADVWLAVTEDELQTDVARGENSGKKLPHTAVVRAMILIDTLAENAPSFSAARSVVTEPGWKKENLNLIVFVQGKVSKQIYAVGKKRLV